MTITTYKDLKLLLRGKLTQKTFTYKGKKGLKKVIIEKSGKVYFCMIEDVPKMIKTTEKEKLYEGIASRLKQDGFKSEDKLNIEVKKAVLDLGFELEEEIIINQIPKYKGLKGETFYFIDGNFVEEDKKTPFFPINEIFNGDIEIKNNFYIVSTDWGDKSHIFDKEKIHVTDFVFSIHKVDSIKKTEYGCKIIKNLIKEEGRMIGYLRNKVEYLFHKGQGYDYDIELNIGYLERGDVLELNEEKRGNEYLFINKETGYTYSYNLKTQEGKFIVINEQRAQELEELEKKEQELEQKKELEREKTLEDYNRKHIEKYYKEQKLKNYRVFFIDDGENNDYKFKAYEDKDALIRLIYDFNYGNDINYKEVLEENPNLMNLSLDKLDTILTDSHCEELYLIKVENSKGEKIAGPGY